MAEESGTPELSPLQQQYIAIADEISRAIVAAGKMAAQDIRSAISFRGSSLNPHPDLPPGLLSDPGPAAAAQMASQNHQSHQGASETPNWLLYGALYGHLDPQIPPRRSFPWDIETTGFTNRPPMDSWSGPASAASPQVSGETAPKISRQPPEDPSGPFWPSPNNPSPGSPPAIPPRPMVDGPSVADRPIRWINGPEAMAEAAGPSLTSGSTVAGKVAGAASSGQGMDALVKAVEDNTRAIKELQKALRENDEDETEEGENAPRKKTEGGPGNPMVLSRVRGSAGESPSRPQPPIQGGAFSQMATQMDQHWTTGQ